MFLLASLESITSAFSSYNKLLEAKMQKCYLLYDKTFDII